MTWPPFTARLRGTLAALLLLSGIAIATARAQSPDTTAAAKADSAASSTATPPVAPPLFDTSGGFNLEAREMLGQEEVGGLRHILLDVRITQKGLVVTAPRGYYYTGRDLVAMGGGVRMVDTTTTVVADSAAFYRTSQRLEAFGKVTVEDATFHVEGKHGTWDRAADRLVLDGGVTGEEENRHFSGDRMEWDRATDRYAIVGHARYEDPERQFILTGQRLDWDATGAAVATGEPSLDWTREGEPLSVTGERLRFDDLGGQLDATGNVTVRQGRQTVTADSARFLDEEGLGWFHGSPKVSDADGTVTGDSLRVSFEDAKIDEAVMLGHAVLDRRPSAPELAGEESRITGDSLTVNFVDGEIEGLSALGSPTIAYKPSKADSAHGTGRIEAKADTIRITIDTGGLNEVRLAGTASGRYLYRSRAGADSVDKVDYAADRILFKVPERMIQLRGQGQTDYGTLTLKADEIDFDAEREELTAQPKPILIDRSQPDEQQVTGNEVTYDLRSTRGTIYHGRTQYDTGYLFADSLRKVTDTELNAGNGRYTTCDLVGQDLEPHYHFTSRRMKVYLGDKVVAKPVTLYIGRVPVFILPFYVFSLKHGRHSGLLLPRLEFGVTSGGDRFFENLGYYWAASDYHDLIFRTAYYENPGALIGEVMGRYARRGQLSGSLLLGHVFGLDEGLNQVLFNHRQTLADQSQLTADLQFEDPEYRQVRGLGQGIGSRVDSRVRSVAGYSKSWPQAGLSLTLNASVDKALDPELDDGVQELILDETLPSLSFTLNPRTLGRPRTSTSPGFLPWASTVSYNLRFSGVSRRSEREFRNVMAATDSTVADTTFGITKSDSKSGTWNFGLVDNRKFFGFLTLGPTFNLDEFWVDREFTPTDTLKGFHRAATFRVGARAALTGYGTLSPHLFGLEAIRHTISPSVGLTWNPEFPGLSYVDSAGAHRPRYPGVGASQARVLTYSLDNRFQAKIRSGADVKRINLFSWRLNGSYNWLADEAIGQVKASDISNFIELTQIRGMTINFNSLHDPNHQLRMENFNFRTSFGVSGRLPGAPGSDAATGENEEGSGIRAVQPESPGLERNLDIYKGTDAGKGPTAEALTWSSDFGFSWNGTRSSGHVQESAVVDGGLTAQISRNWGMSYSTQYSFDSNSLVYQDLRLIRQLHCWEAQFSYQATGETSEYSFRIGVKSLPDIKFESGPGLGTSDILGRVAPGGGF